MPTQPTLRIGTRQSPLALAQTELLKRKMTSAFPLLETEYKLEVVPMTTTGDHILDRNLAAIGGKGLFTKEIEEALLHHHIDLAVHSMKDVPASFPEPLIIPCILKREDPRDALIGPYHSIDTIPARARIGTSSIRRSAQLHHLRPDLTIVPFRGNIQTRIKKLNNGFADAAFLAVAGLKRMELESHITTIFDPSIILPAIGQGAIGIQCRRNDQRSIALLSAINHADSYDCIQAERGVMERLDGSCRTPIAALAQIMDGGQLMMEALIANPDGSSLLRQAITGQRNEARNLGLTLGQQLLDLGGDKILNLIPR